MCRCRHLVLLATLACGGDGETSTSSASTSSASTSSASTSSASAASTSSTTASTSPETDGADGLHPVCVRWKEAIEQVDFGPLWTGSAQQCLPGQFENPADVALLVALYRWLAGLTAPVVAMSSAPAQACALAELSPSCEAAFSVPLVAATHAVLAPREWFGDPATVFRLLGASADMELGSTNNTSCALGLPFALPAVDSWPPSGPVPVEALPPVWSMWRVDPWPENPAVTAELDGMPVEVTTVHVGGFPLVPGSYKAEVQVPNLGPGTYTLKVGDREILVTALDCGKVLWPQL